MSRSTSSSRYSRKLWFAGLAVGCFVPLLCAATHLRIWSWHDWETYRNMSRECHPVWRELHFGRIRPEQDIGDVITSTKPLRIDRYSEFVVLSYHKGLSFTQVTIVAKNQKVVQATAFSCTWTRTFFDIMSPQDLEKFLGEYSSGHAQSKDEK